MSDDQVTIEVNGQALQVRKGAMIIEATDGAGVTVPRFCYHKKLSVAANCRMCLVEVERAPKPLPACATPVADGMKIYTRSTLALKAQKAVMEFLLINHPLDCPICDQGGECELQDVAMGFGRSVSRFTERKRVVKDKNVGPLISTDMTRCIHCTRCVRFGQEIAGLQELGATGRGENMEIGTFIERSVDSELSGNVIDVCPVGALTSKPYRFRARAWEMVQRNSVALHDAVGSSVHVHLARERVMRVVPRENESVNEVWISDRDRFSYDGLYSDDRLETPMIKNADGWQSVDWDTALSFTAERLRSLVANHGADALGALASPSATVEELYLLQKIMRALGSPNIDHRLRERDFRDQSRWPNAPGLGQSVADLESLDAALLVGCNIRKEQPIAGLRLRKAAVRGARVMAVNPVDYSFNFPLAESVIAGPSAMIEALAGIAMALSPDALSGLDGATGAKVNEQHRAGEKHRAIADYLKQAERATLLLGLTAVAHPQAALIRALSARIAAESGAKLGFFTAGANSAGAWTAGAIPHRGPAGANVSRDGLDARRMLEQGLRGYVLLGIEPEHDCGDSCAARKAMASAETVVSFSAFRTPEIESYADVMLPIALFAENTGSFIGADGEWREFDSVVSAPGDTRPAWRVLRVLGNCLELDGFEYQTPGDVRDELRALPQEQRASNGDFGALDALSPAVETGLVRLGEVPMYSVDALVRRAPALQQTADSGDAVIRINPEVAGSLGLADGDSAHAVQNGSRVALTVHIDGRVADGCALVAAGVSGSVGLGPDYGPMSLEKA